MSNQGNALEQLAPLSIDDFADFFKAVHRYRPFQWQMRLAEQACRGALPDFLKLPTSSGKTAAIDVAIYALAYQAAVQNRPAGKITAARRIFFVVDRRIIVNEAYLQTRTTAQKLWDAVQPAADDSILRRVGSWLRHLAGGGAAPPLDCRELRGGIYRDDAWIRSPLQPSVLTSTVDQVGSRMLFRGYGVSDRNLPIHAAMTANDSLIILDEAHCSRPFSQTLDAVARYRGERWAAQHLPTPFSLVQMTATPPKDLGDKTLFTLSENDYVGDPLLQIRHGCEKPIRLILDSNAKGKALPAKLAKALVDQALVLADQHNCMKIAIVVNRVAIARAAYDLLCKKHSESTSLMIGRMRPIDRDVLTEDLQDKFASRSTQSFESPQFVVTTQCLEVGADLNFDGMVSQCASLNALRQRFGRLNRLGEASHSRGVVVAAEGDLQPINKLNDEKPLDPIYGNALARTWHWLVEQAGEKGEVNFGIQDLDERIDSQKKTSSDLAVPALDAPVLMPAHVDMLCQTNPRPIPEPDVAAYLHGPERRLPEVRVCWRADLELNEGQTNRDKSLLAKNWIDAVEVCPPSTAECMSVPLQLFRRWIRGEKLLDLTGDVLGERVEEETSDKAAESKSSPRRMALVWRGKSRRGRLNSARREPERSFRIDKKNANRIAPEDTIVIPAEFGGWNEFGFIPDAPTEWPDPWRRYLGRQTDDGIIFDLQKQYALAKIDIADRAFEQSRARTILRVHPKLPTCGVAARLASELMKTLTEPEADLGLRTWKTFVSELLRTFDDDEATATDAHGRALLERLANTDGTIVRYPGGVAWKTGLQKEQVGGMPPLPLEHFGDDTDSLSETGQRSLLQHLADVDAESSRTVGALELPESLQDTITTAARLHDVGKADPRFQAMLLGKPLSVAFMQRKLWAKSDIQGGNRISELPPGFRHEMLSLHLLDRFKKGELVDSELLAHIVASHHGNARPLAPICIDESPPGFSLDSLGVGLVTSDERTDWLAAHRIESGIAARFWSLSRKYGWWGLAYIESILRLSDWKASANPGAGQVDRLSFASSAQKPEVRAHADRPSLVLCGIDGSKPLGYLAALGTFRVVANEVPNHNPLFSWKQTEGAWRPVICFDDGFQGDQDWMIDLLIDRLETDPDNHPAIRLAQNDTLRHKQFLDVVLQSDLAHRIDADWLSSSGSDAAPTDAISQLQTSRRDYHAINIKGLLTETEMDHLSRSLFETWDYADPIAGVSLHLEPREDRRHAYQWHTPSGDPTRKSSGGMIGANRLALEAWPLFQSLPSGDRLRTVGFHGLRANNTQLTWPIWTGPIPIAVVRSILSFRELQPESIESEKLSPIGIAHAYRVKRILVGKTPNLTSAVAVNA